MTTATLHGKRITLTIEQKARLLQVIDVHEPGVLAVRSANDPRLVYAVYHDGKHVTSCACTGCRQYGRTHCAYRLAAFWHLEAINRNAYCQMFHIYE